MPRKRLARGRWAVAGAGASLCAMSAFAVDVHSATAKGANDSPQQVSLAGRSVSCGKIRTRLDAHLPNLGIAVPEERLLLLNPALLRRETATVQLFVYHHECGHHHVGGSELGADCWAVERGVREGWLGAGALSEVCHSFGDTPETPTHPASRRRCAALERCFAKVSAALTREPAARMAAAGSGAAAVGPPAGELERPAIRPKLVKAPLLAWSGRVARVAEAVVRGDRARP